MIFLNALLALGALAFTVPLAIHLLFRNRFEVLDWGAMQFLESVVRVNRRRMKLRNLLLLLVRCAIPILLAFCLARPVLTGWRTLPGDEPMSLVLALDVSDSLAQQIGAGENQAVVNRFQRVIQSAEQVVAALPRGSDVTLVTSAAIGNESSDSAPRIDPQAVLDRLRAMRAGGRPLEIESLLSEALRTSSTATTERRQIVIITDDRVSDFSQSQLDLLPAVGDRRASLQPAPAIAWIDAWDDLPPIENNRRITKLEPSQSAAVPGQSLTWDVQARCDGDAALSTTVQWIVDGERIDSKPLTFRGGVATASFTTTFDDTGRHVVEVTMPTEDAFAPDDRLRVDYRIYPPIEVWLVDGNPSDKPLQNDTGFLAIALSPFSLAGDKSIDLFHTTRIPLRQLASETDAAPSLVVLADVRKLPDESARWLSDYVEKQQGNLVVFAGPSTEAEVYDKQLVTAAAAALLPMRWGQVKRSSEGSAGLKIDERQLTYPPLAALAVEAKGTLPSVEVSGYRMMLPRVETAESQVVLRLDNGDPLVVVGKVGSGQVMQIATTANDRWTSLPRRLAFVPLVQRMFMHLATGELRTTTPQVGESIVIDLPDEPAGGEWTVTKPDGITESLAATSAKLVYPNVPLAGLYRFESPTGAAIYASANIAQADLKLTSVPPGVRDDAAKRVGAVHYASATAYQDDESTKRFGRGVWRWLLLALLAVMILEPFLQQRSARAEP